jgi:hypothetical protein
MKVFGVLLLATCVNAVPSLEPNNEPIGHRENLASLNHSVQNHSNTNAMKCSTVVKKTDTNKHAAKKMSAQPEPTDKKGGATKVYKLDTVHQQRVD